jgi:hypothetical protein
MSVRATAAAAIALAAGTLAPAACGNADTRAHNARTAESDMVDGSPQESWITLFDSTDLSAWRGYRRADIPAGWQIRDGLLAFVPGRDGGDLITREQFDDFELRLDWRVGPGGNSGIFYRATEDHEAIWHGAPEMQVLDDAGHRDGGDPATSAGAAYALYAPATDAVRPAGEWNQVRIIARGPRVEHWLNGERIVAYEIGSDDWNARVRASKFVEWPEFAHARRGHIGLQDHGDPVWYRVIRIRPLPESEAP